MTHGKVFLLAIILSLSALTFTPSAPAAVSVEREFYTQVEQRPAARRHASRTLHRYRPREHSRRASRWSIKRPVRPVGVPPPGFVRSKSGATARVNPAVRQNFQCLVDKLDAAGYRIDFMGGYGARSFRQSKHPLGLALDVNQTSRNRVTVRLPATASEMARACGLFHGAQWAHADAGHFETTGGRVPWPRLIAPPDRQRDLARAIPLPPVKVARIPLPLSRPVLAADFAVLDIVPPELNYNVALLDTEAMPVALTSDVIESQPAPEPLPSLNIFEVFADALMRPVGNCQGWEKIAPGVKRIVADATRHFSRKYNQTLIAEANSCARDKNYNRRVRGARNSAHLRNAALDFKIVSPDHTFTVPQDELWRFCKAHPLAKGCGIYKYKGIIHADVDRVLGRRAWDWRAGRNKKFAKAKLKKKQKFAKLKSKKKKKWHRYAGR